MLSKCYRSRQRPDRSQSYCLSEDCRTYERGKSPAWRLSVDNLPLGLEATPKAGDYPRSILPGKSNLLSGKSDLDLYIGANESLSKEYSAGSLHYAKVFPREMSPSHANPPPFISKLTKTTGQRYIDTPGTVYQEVFVDSPQGGIVLSSSFAGAAVQKTKGPADT